MTDKTDKKIETIKTDETLPDLPKDKVAEAKLEGALDAVREGAKLRFKATDGVGVTSDPEPGVQATYDVFHLQYLVDLDPDALKAALEGEKGQPSLGISQSQVAGLIEVERSGKNRTDIVKVLCDYLGLKTPYEVTNAGPNYTNRVDRDVVKPRG